MSASRAFALLLLVGALLALIPAVVESSCVGSGRMSTPNMVVDVDGDVISFWPINKGERVLNFYNLTLDFTTIGEYLRDPKSMHRCAYDTDAKNMIQEMKFTENFTCSVTTGTEALHASATVDTIVLNYTSSVHPDMRFLVSFYVTDTFFEIRPSDNRTYVDEGQEYEWTFDPNKIKFSFDLLNFPFQGPDRSPTTNASYVLLTYSYSLSVEDVIVFTWDEPYSGGINVTRSDGATMTWNLDKGGLYDGVPVFIADKDTKGTLNRSGPTPVTYPFPPAPATIPLCAETHYKRGIYDPTFVTLFAPDPNQPTTPLTPEQREKKRAYTIGASIGSVLAVGVVVAFVLVAWGQPTLSRLADPQKMPKAVLSTD